MRPIDADELLDEICRDQCERKYKDCDSTCEIAAYVVNAPTIGGEVRTPDGKGYWMVPVDETRLVRNYSRPGVYADLWLHCEKCGGMVDDRYTPKYCPECGRKVAWS